jgi:Putative beta-barrel porin-2, OmpL-like. bbp2
MDTLESTVIGHVGIGGYIDTYYSYNFRYPEGEYTPYLVNSARQNSMSVNLAYIDLRYRSKNLRARFVPGFGTYMNLNYANEPGTLKNIVEGYVGVRLSEKKNIWLDAGVFGSPYTNESAISKDHLMYTRSFAPEYVPYYLSGVKLSVPLAARWNAYVYLLNGWQVIDDDNSKKSIGTQVEFRPNDKMLFNWNTYIGDERNDSQPDYRTRWFSDVFLIFKANEKWDFTSCAYLGNQQYENSDNQLWWQANGIARYTFAKKSSLSGRLEYFSDAGAVVAESVAAQGSGFRSFSTGLCYNYKVNKNALFRIEGRYFFSHDSVYPDDNSVYKQSTLLVASLTAWF